MIISVSVQGHSPLLCNRFTDAQAIRATEGMRNSSAGGDKGTPREIAESKLYLDDKGRPCIPQPNILRCIVDGGVFHKMGKKQITTQKSSLVYACLNVISDPLIPIKHKQPWSVDSRPVVNPSTNGRFLCYRPRFDDWELSFDIELDTDTIGVKLARYITDDSGKKIGLGDFRPAKKGPFGRFVVTRWVEKPAQLREAAE